MDVLVSKIVCVLAFGVYVYVGGYLAVVWTDVIQLGILLVGFAAIIIKAVPSAGGWDAIRATYEAAGNNGAMTFYGLGSTGFMAAISLIVASALGEMGAPTFRTRIYTAKDPKTARKGFIFAAIMTLLFSLVPSIIGMSAYTMASANEVLAVLENPDFAFAYMATNVLAPALGLPLMVSGLSATLSSGDSDAIAGATILMEDIYPLFNHGKRIPENKMKNASRIAVVITLFASFLVSLKADGVMAFINNVLGAMMPGMVLTLIIGRLWTKRVTAAAGMCSMVGGTLFGAAVGVLLGIIAAIHRNKFADNLIMVLSLLTVSTPSFFLALILMLIFCLNLRWLPSIGMDTWQGAVLPIATLGLQAIGSIARTTRSAMLDVIHQDYIRTSRSRGVPERVITYRHAFKNALIPVLTTIGLRFGGLLAGATLVETVFSIPGIGRFVVDSVSNRDYPAIQGAVLVLAVTFVLVNTLVDLLYAAVDPRVKYD